MPSSTARVPLLAADGQTVATYVAEERDGEPCADAVQREGELSLVVDAALEQWAGWQVAADPELGRALLVRGAETVRHAHTMTVDTSTADDTWRTPVLAPGLRIESIDLESLSPLSLLPSQQAAYPPGHPDHETDIGTLLGLLVLVMGGDVVGPLLPESALVWHDDEVVAGVLITQRPGEAPLGGAWVADVWRHPDYRGLGTVVMRRAIAGMRERGETFLSLTVTEGNPARQRYEALGFDHRIEALRVRLPAS